MLDTFASSSKFIDEKTGQLVYQLLLDRKIVSLFENPNLSSEFILTCFSKAPNAQRIALACREYTPAQMEKLIASEKSIKVINALIASNKVNTQTADLLFATHGAKIVPGLFVALDRDYQYFIDKLNLLKGYQLMEFIYLNYEKISKEQLELIFTQPEKYFTPSSYTNLLLSNLIDYHPELLTQLTSLKQLNIFDSVIASHLYLSSAQAEALYVKLIANVGEESRYALMALAASPITPNQLLNRMLTSNLDYETKKIVSKNLAEKAKEGYQVFQAVLNRSLPSMFKTSGRLGNLLSLNLHPETSGTIKQTALATLTANLDSLLVIKKNKLILPIPVVEEEVARDTTLNKINLERYLSSPARYLSTYYILDDLSKYLEIEFGLNKMYWENFFTLSSSFEGTLGELIDTSKKL